MPYFKAPDNSLHFLTDDDVVNGWTRVLPEGCEQLSDDEASQEIQQRQQVLDDQV